ncbi:MAG: kynureninase, partial [Gammaproteobacteria bacterium]|nr:kynureninase [Gammaproteobacteria bacterium]
MHDEAVALDRTDELRDFRARFALPRDAAGAGLCYLCGHSLGLAPLAARARVLEELEDWERLGVLGHEHGRRAWVGYAERLAPLLAGLAGAQPGEVVAMNSLTVNLHLLLASFYRPTRERHRILIEAGAFPSDRYLVESQLRWHGFDPASSLIELQPRAGAELLRTEDIDAAIGAAGKSLALVLWPGVQYRTGQAFELAPIVTSAHRNGTIVGFDLAHAIGNLPLALHDSGADFAAWCSYKYLNGGPGAIGGAFVHERHGRDAAVPRIAGWWGSNPATRFSMGSEFELTPGAAGWQLSNPPVLSAAPLFASLELFAAAGMTRLRAKSRTLTDYLARALRARCGAALDLVSPADAAQRGAQLSVRVRGGAERARRVFEALQPRGVVADWREPDIIRLAPAPLYNSY